MEWLADWCFVRGQNLLFPHAFYYSVRGPRFDERPPDVGPNASWWNSYKSFADACRRLSWLNTDSRQVCHLAILCEANMLPDKTAKVCYRNQRDFNYLETCYLWQDARVDEKGIHLAVMDYEALIIDTLSYMPAMAIPNLKKLARNNRLIIMKNSPYADMFEGAVIVNTPEEITTAVDKIIQPDLILVPPSEGIRYRHILKGDNQYYILFNEEASEVQTTIKLKTGENTFWLNPHTAEAMKAKENEFVLFMPYELKILAINNKK
jgi:hypothetical protein